VFHLFNTHYSCRTYCSAIITAILHFFSCIMNFATPFLTRHFTCLRRDTHSITWNDVTLARAIILRPCQHVVSRASRMIHHVLTWNDVKPALFKLIFSNLHPLFKFISNLPPLFYHIYPRSYSRGLYAVLSHTNWWRDRLPTDGVAVSRQMALPSPIPSIAILPYISGDTSPLKCSAATSAHAHAAGQEITHTIFGAMPPKMFFGTAPHFWGAHKRPSASGAFGPTWNLGPPKLSPSSCFDFFTAFTVVANSFMVKVSFNKHVWPNALVCYFGLHSSLGFCWHWSFIKHAYSICETFFPSNYKVICIYRQTQLYMRWYAVYYM
jgi:hypothetical protein